MNNRIQDKTDELLIITAEEAGELTQACTKILRHGVDEQKIKALTEEVGDMQCMIELLVAHNMMTQEDIEKRTKVKLEKLEKYSNLWPKKQKK